MEKVRFGQTDLEVSVLVLGTWVTGGWAWGGADDGQSVRAIQRALELGINFIDTAPVYGFGRSERIVGQALKEWGARDSVAIATKCGLEWDEKENIRRNSSPARIREEVDQSLHRLGLERIDLYQIHWPDNKSWPSRVLVKFTVCSHHTISLSGNQRKSFCLSARRTELPPWLTAVCAEDS